MLLDSDTTNTSIAPALKKFSHLRIITHAVNIAAELRGTDLEVLLWGACQANRHRAEVLTSWTACL